MRRKKTEKFEKKATALERLRAGYDAVNLKRERKLMQNLSYVYRDKRERAAKWFASLPPE